MADQSTLAVTLDKPTYVEGEPIKFSSTGTVVRTTVTDMGPELAAAGTVATLGMGPITVPFTLDDGTTVNVTVPAPTVTAKPPPPPAITNGVNVKAGSVRWGCAYGSNALPTPHEQAAGKSVGLRRTYYTLTSTSTMIATAKADIAAGRVPWMSAKMGSYTWAQVGAGQADSAILALLNGWKVLGGPVWFTPHHEPDEEFGTTNKSLADWKAMNVRWRKLITDSGAKNVALAPCFMAWSFGPQPTGNHKATDAWFCPNTWDFIGFDVYFSKGGQTDFTAPTVQNGTGFNAVVAWAKKFGLPVAIGEWGTANHGDAIATQFIQTTYDICVRSAAGPGQFVGAAYFDVPASVYGGTTSYVLTDGEKTKFESLMKAPTSILAGSAG